MMCDECEMSGGEMGHGEMSCAQQPSGGSGYRACSCFFWEGPPLSPTSITETSRKRPRLDNNKPWRSTMSRQRPGGGGVCRPRWLAKAWKGTVKAGNRGRKLETVGPEN